MKKFNLCFIILMLFGYTAYSYITPGNPTVDWTKAGTTYMDSVTQASPLYASNESELFYALANRDRSKRTRIIIDSCDIVINSPIVLDSNVILSGWGQNATKLLFNLGNSTSCITVQGNTVGSEIDIDSDYPECIDFGSTSLVLEDASTIHPGDYIKFYVDHDNIWYSTHKYGPIYSNIGQILKVTAKNGNTIILDDGLHLDFQDKPVLDADWGDLDPRIIKIKPAHHVGIEDLYIGLSISSGKNQNNIQFYYAAHCWVTNIKSENPTFNHISFSNSINVTVEGSFFRKGNKVYGGGMAYGILLSNTTTSCLVENNVFYYLRHAICFAGGANGNVAAYNYSHTTVFAPSDDVNSPMAKWLCEDTPCSDYYFHGHYPFSNLVEGNMGHYIHFENTWGSNGPYNMIFKNATLDHDESFGLQINEGHPYQNVIGNYITYMWSYISRRFFIDPLGPDARQKFEISSNYCYIYHNYDNGEYKQGIVFWDALWHRDWDPMERRNDWHNEGSDSELPDSYYLTRTPDFWPAGEWPYIARYDLDDELPAKERYDEEEYDLDNFKFVKLKNVDYATGDTLNQGFLAMRRMNYSDWYDSIPSYRDVKISNVEDTVDVKVLQEVIGVRKHHDWDGIRTKFKVKSYEHRIGTDNSIQAQFATQSSISAFWSEPVQVYLKDPWYVSVQQTLEQPESFREISSGVSQNVFIGEGGYQFEYPYYIVRASKRYYATTDSIYEFSHWSSPNSKATFDPNNVKNYNGCGVRFDDENAIIKPNYVAVNDIEDYTISISSSDTLIIPQGADICFADGFEIEIEGCFSCKGSITDTIQLTGNGKNLSSPFMNNYLNPTTDTLLKVLSSNADIDIDYSCFSDLPCGLHLKHLNQYVYVTNSKFFNNNIGIAIDEISSSNYILDSLHFYNNDIGVAISPEFPDESQQSYISIVHSVFYNHNDCGIFLIPTDWGTTNYSKLELDIINCTFWDEDDFIYIKEPDSFYGDCDISLWNNILGGSIGLTFYHPHNKFMITEDSNVSSIVLNDLSEEIVTNPQIISPDNLDFRLRPMSQCIDGGCQPLNEHFDIEYDPDGTIPDIGAYYCHQATFSGTIDSDTTWYGIINVTGDVTVSSGVKLEIEPYSTIEFDDDTGIRVYGILQADGGDSSSITFTSSNATPAKGDWDYIRFENSSVDDSCYIKNCKIEYGHYSVYCYYAKPTIQNNTLYKNNYAVYFYHSSPTYFETNYLHQNSYGIYGNSSNAQITDNYFLSNSSRGCYFTSSSAPKFFDNTFESNYYGAYFSYSDPEFGPKVGSGKGNNILKDGTVGIRSYNSDPFLGSSDGYNTRIGGYNELVSNSSYNVYAQSSSDVDAQWCWWGTVSSPPPPNLYSDGTSSINYNNYLSSSTGGGSSLAKMTSVESQSISGCNPIYIEAGFDPKKPNPNKLSDLWLWGYDLSINGKSEDALEIYQKLVSKFSNDGYAKKALRKIYFLSQNSDNCKIENYFTKLLVNPNINENVYPTIYNLLLIHSIDQNRIKDAIIYGEKILDKYPKTDEEKMALFDLVLACANRAEHQETASKYLELMREKYSGDELTLMAREAMGEKCFDSLGNGKLLS